MTHTAGCISKLKAAAIYLCSLVLCGCSTTQVIGKFQSLKTIQMGTKHLHVILVHGISKHDPGWSGDFYTKLAESLGIKNVDEDAWGKCVFIDGVGKLDDLSQCAVGKVPSSADGVLKSVTLRVPDSTETVTITEVTWSPITTVLKQKLLAYDKVGDVSKSRAWANRYLREGLVDDGFADALAYAGKPGERIRDVVWKGICYSMAGRIEDGEACDLGAVDHRFAFITHSLGSRVVFDALRVGEEDKIKAAKNLLLILKQKAISQVSTNTVAVYMLANQLPLLEMADEAGVKVSAHGLTLDKSGRSVSPATSLGRFLEEREAFHEIETKSMLGIQEGRKLPPISIAAFSDPNDILSYSLCQSDMRELAKVDVADVWVRNATNFLLFANPMSAHQDYWANKDVISLLVGGEVAGKQTCGASASDGSQ